ncbi:hypothetical protein EDB83DRAFT_2318045 [Lactarius deliciosus]|nr:hypothetical protein EDB83DRAFT_2318045 [Lactarius deliciosus]
MTNQMHLHTRSTQMLPSRIAPAQGALMHGTPLNNKIYNVLNAVAPFMNQDQRPDNRQETALGAPDRVWAQITHLETVGTRIQDNIGYVPVPERAGPPNVGLLQAPILDASIAEGRRRLAGRYLNNPDAYVRMIRLEPGSSGQFQTRFQIIITLEMANIL